MEAGYQVFGGKLLLIGLMIISVFIIGQGLVTQ